MRTASYGYPLKAHDVGDEERHALTAVRAIVAASANPEVHLSVPGLAKATGLTEDVVHELLTSDTYKEMLLGTCKQRCAALLNRGISRMEDIVNTSQDAEIVLKAISTATSLYNTLNKTAGHVQLQSRKDGEELIKMLELTAMNRISDSTATASPASVVLPRSNGAGPSET